MRGDLETVLNWVKTNELFYWRIVDKHTGNAVARFDNEVDTSTSLDLLNQNLNFLKDGKYSIFARKNYKGTNGELEFSFNIGEPKTEIAGLGGASTEIGYIMQIADLKRQLDLKDMQHKFDLQKAKQQTEDTKTDVLDRVSKIFGMIKDLEGKTPEPNIAGLPEQEALAKNLENLSRYLTIEELLKLTSKLADLLKLNPEAVKEQLKKNNLL